ncbi:hypothetical protein FGG08_002993 [Glutinoglossum americanum]|uniref:PPIase cyclophilin-type domain-containing protein n=1 Tax=Glutinoglossum americanum TaxID=1670608 RepID=A0A9P8KYL1_9PEZI|nr:hypothetical protein FGG08_002993 [Glutinoglossum americanum]
MSTVYNLEPAPTAKVLLNTTSGDILLELFAKQTPLTSRNFLQLCLNGYYNDTIFHRLVPGFIIQGGDPTGTGEGGESIYNDNANNVFTDEFHSRLKFNRRGLLGMANGGRKDDNGSQFFLSLGKTEELTGKNTMFGRVVGDTIYNLMKMSEAELVEGTERPLYPTKILSTEILVNPFEDVAVGERRAVRGDDTEVKKEIGRRKAKRKSGKALLSFGADEGEDGGEAVITKKAKFNTKLVSAGPEPTLENGGEGDIPAPRPPATEATTTTTTTKPSPPYPLQSRPQQQNQQIPPPRSSPRSRSPSPTPPPPQTLLHQTLTQITNLTHSLKRRPSPPPQKPSPKKSTLASLIPPTSTRARKRGAAHQDPKEDLRALHALEAFRRKLEGAGPHTALSAAATAATTTTRTNNSSSGTKESAENDNDEEEVLCDLHFLANCLSCNPHATDGNPPSPSNDNDTAWLSHSLTFAKDRLGKDLDWKRKNEELAVEDPWEGRAGVGGGNGSGGVGKGKGKYGKGGGGGRAWDNRR